MSRLVNEYGEPIEDDFMTDDEDDDICVAYDTSLTTPSCIVHKVDLMDETIDKIAEAVMRKIKEEKK